MNPIPVLTTSRLVLREFREMDAEPLHHLLGEQGVLRYFPDPNPPTLERVQRFIAFQLAHWDQHGFGWWAVVPNGERELVGWSGLQYLPETDEIEVGYLLGRPFWGHGYATEGARASLQFGFENLKLEQIIALVHPENVASQRVLDNLGMEFTRRAVYFGMEMLRYSLDRSIHSNAAQHR